MLINTTVSLAARLRIIALKDHSVKCHDGNHNNHKRSRVSEA
ncbi:hypothetical protein GPUN_1212 [Glaciecola punicea ACAM 611]|uniref:Uncharacterized protein n=1 Tax=Glaciecola punicea ACAM 611 TaxID=1121923 RepID=H5TAK9_9ALTE|nr:hypothetical protein GPUN_1212 [Glaciecola punicea ACAM 611]